MWISFSCNDRTCYVIRPFVGGVNAISGESLTGDMQSVLRRLNFVAENKQQDYLVLPRQHWLDGIATSPGVIKQFVATPMLSPAQQDIRRSLRQEREIRRTQDPNTDQGDFEFGASIELQLTGYDRTGGFQLAIIPEFDVKRMSFSASPNTWYTDTETATLQGKFRGRRGKLDVLRTPKELGFSEGDKIHMKDLGNPTPDRPRVLSDLWAEALDHSKIPNGVALEVHPMGWQARISITCEQCQKVPILEIKVCGQAPEPGPILKN